MKIQPDFKSSASSSLLRWFIVFAILLILPIWGCKKPSQRKAPEVPALSERIAMAEVPYFNADSAYEFVARQVAFGPRVPNTSAHVECGIYLTETLRRFTPYVTVQETRVRAFDGTVLNIKNIIGVFKPEAEARILLCAHWDSRPFADFDPDPANHRTPILGANDGASGVGVLLEMARQFSLHPPPVGVDIILFDAEDYGEPHGYENPRAEHWALGSQYWSRNPHVPNYRARFGILPDMVGATDAVFTFEGTSMQYAPDIMRRVWDVGHALGYSSYFLRQNTSPIIHDHYFINKLTGIPVINIIHYDAESPSGWFFDQWHTIEDDMDVIDPVSLGVVGRTMLTVVFLEN